MLCCHFLFLNILSSMLKNLDIALTKYRENAGLIWKILYSYISLATTYKHISARQLAWAYAFLHFLNSVWTIMKQYAQQRASCYFPWDFSSVVHRPYHARISTRTPVRASSVLCRNKSVAVVLAWKIRTLRINSDTMAALHNAVLSSFYEHVFQSLKERQL